MPCQNAPSRSSHTNQSVTVRYQIDPLQNICIFINTSHVFDTCKIYQAINLLIKQLSHGPTLYILTFYVFPPNVYMS